MTSKFSLLGNAPLAKLSVLALQVNAARCPTEKPSLFSISYPWFIFLLFIQQQHYFYSFFSVFSVFLHQNVSPIRSGNVSFLPLLLLHTRHSASKCQHLAFPELHRQSMVLRISSAWSWFILTMALKTGSLNHPTPIIQVRKTLLRKFRKLKVILVSSKNMRKDQSPQVSTSQSQENMQTGFHFLPLTVRAKSELFRYW